MRLTKKDEAQEESRIFLASQNHRSIVWKI